MVHIVVHVLMQHQPGAIGVTLSLRLGAPYSTAPRLEPLFCMYLKLGMVMFLGGCCTDLREIHAVSAEPATQLWIVQRTRYGYFVTYLILRTIYIRQIST